MTLVLVQMSWWRASSACGGPAPENLVLFPFPVNLEVIGFLCNHVNRIATICVPERNTVEQQDNEGD